MRFEHGSLRAECLAALIILLCCCRCCSAAEEGALPPFAGLRTFRQCLRLGEGVGPREACGPNGRHVRLRFCDAYEPARVLDPCDGPALDRLRTLDESAEEAACRFRQLIERYDCENANSVSWTCKDCEEAYKQWVCAMFLPPVRVGEGGGERVMKPCRYICRLVEQRCPYFHPSVRDQYAGERVFKCIDPDIPDLDSIEGVSSYGPPHRCYCPQHLGTPHDAPEEAECRLLSPAQLQRRNASSSAHHHHHQRTTSGDAERTSASLTLLVLALLTMLLWTR